MKELKQWISRAYNKKVGRKTQLVPNEYFAKIERKDLAKTKFCKKCRADEFQIPKK